jgi:hypothetical protein
MSLIQEKSPKLQKTPKNNNKTLKTFYQNPKSPGIQLKTTNSNKNSIKVIQNLQKIHRKEHLW